MLHRLLRAAWVLMLLAPVTLQGQQDTVQAQDTAQAQEQQRPTLVISQWKCDWQEMDTIMSSIEEVLVPVWEDMQQEGLLEGAGVYVHAWGDEWNFNMYRIATDEQALFRAYDEEGQRVQDRLGELNMAADTPGPLQEHCTEHRDNIYTLGPSVPGGGNQ